MAGPVVAGEPHSPDRATAVRLGVGTALVLVVGGLVFGVLGAFLQAVTITLGSVTIPVGLVVVLAALLAFLRALVHTFDRRLAAVWFFAGWAIASVASAIPWPGGDIVLGDSTTAKIYLFGGAILASAAANLPARLRPAPPPPADAS